MVCVVSTVCNAESLQASLTKKKHLVCMSVGGVVDVDSWRFLPQPQQNPGECMRMCVCHVHTQ